MFPHKLTDTCPNAFAWGIIAFGVLVALVGMTELDQIRLVHLNPFQRPQKGNGEKGGQVARSS